MNCWQSLQKSFLFFHYYKLNLYFSNFSLFYYLLVYKPNIELLPCVESFLSISYTNKISFLFFKFNFKIFPCNFVIVSLVSDVYDICITFCLVLSWFGLCRYYIFIYSQIQWHNAFCFALNFILMFVLFEIVFCF